MGKTPILELNITPATDTQKLFKDWRAGLDGDTPDSSMMKLEAKIPAHMNDEVKHVTQAKQDSWNAKETPTGAQNKANTAETNAKNASVPIATKGVANGVAPLDTGGLVPLQHLPASVKEVQVVANISARNAIAEKFSGLNVFVKDATADTTVKTGGATYIYDGTAWFKTGEAESMDVVLSWGNIVEKPTTFAPSAHTHAPTDVTGLQGQLDGKAPIANPNFTGNVGMSGNLTLKGAGNFGNKISFGDGDYVHISEPTDDTLELSGSHINIKNGTTTALQIDNGIVKYKGHEIGRNYIFNVTLTVAGWSASAPFTQTLSVAEMSVDYYPDTNLVPSSDATTAAKQKEAYNCVTAISTANGSITATCLDTKPLVDITLKMVEVR